MVKTKEKIQLLINPTKACANNLVEDIKPNRRISLTNMQQFHKIYIIKIKIISLQNLQIKLS